MGFLDKMLKDVEKGVGRAQFEADKALKVNNLKSEIEKLKRERHDLLAQIGEEAVALYSSGSIALPGLDMQIAKLKELREQMEAKEAQLAAVQAAQFQPAAAAGAPAPAPEPAAQSAPEPAAQPVTPAPAVEPVTPAAEAAPAAARPVFCQNCGAKLPASGAFCPSCGAKI
jgi:hypothetical protein